MKRFSEYVSPGHPDKMADYLSSYLLDRILEKDPNAKYAVEVQIKDNHVTYAGEVSSTIQLTLSMVQQYTKDAVNAIGYTREYQDKWGKNNTICGDDMIAHANISFQSPEIAQGLDGWGDQGIFFGYAEPDEETHYMPKDHAIAKSLCKMLFESGKCGLDIKTQIVMDDDKLKKVIVACPLLDGNTKLIRSMVRRFLCRKYCIMPFAGYKIIVNGTGSYVRHSTIADCGTTGRKLAVDFYGGNAKIGGGSPWTKDGSKADLTLNLIARKFAQGYARKLNTAINVALCCCIGKQDVEISITDTAGNVILESSTRLCPKDIIEANNLNKPIYTSMCMWGLFGEFQQDKLWER